MNKDNATVQPNKTTAPRDQYLNVDPLNIIVEDGFNVRQDYGDIDELAQSIIENGQIMPVTVVKSTVDPDRFVLVDGHRRYRAIQRAKEMGHDFPFVKALLTKAVTAEQRLLAMIVTGTNSKPFTAVEEAEAYRRLIDRGYSASDIAAKVGKSPAHVGNLLSLSSMNKDVKDLVSDGTVAASVVIAAQRDLKDADSVSEVLKEAVNEAKASGSKKVKGSVVKKKTTKAAKKKADQNGGATPKSAIVKHVTIKFLKDAFEKIGGEESKGHGAVYLHDLIIELEDPNSTAESVGAIFNK